MLKEMAERLAETKMERTQRRQMERQWREYYISIRLTDHFDFERQKDGHHAATPGS